jgi:hypothetical protein
MKALVLRDLDLLGKDTSMVKAILGAPNSPDTHLSTYHGKLISEATNKKASLVIAKAE